MLPCIGINIVMPCLRRHIHNFAGQDFVRPAVAPDIYFIDIISNIECKLFRALSSVPVCIIHSDFALTAVLCTQSPAIFTFVFDVDHVLSLHVLTLDARHSEFCAIPPRVLLVLHIAALSAVDPLVPSGQKGVRSEIPVGLNEALFDVKFTLTVGKFFAFTDDGCAHFYASYSFIPKWTAIQRDSVTAYMPSVILDKIPAIKLPASVIPAAGSDFPFNVVSCSFRYDEITANYLKRIIGENYPEIISVRRILWIQLNAPVFIFLLGLFGSHFLFRLFDGFIVSSDSSTTVSPGSSSSVVTSS